MASPDSKKTNRELAEILRFQGMQTAWTLEVGLKEIIARILEANDNGWIKVEDDLPEITGLQDGGTDRVLVKFGNAHYAPRVVIASGEWTEDGFIWSFERGPYKKGEPVTEWREIPK